MDRTARSGTGRTRNRRRATAVRVVALALAGAGLVGVIAPTAGAVGATGPGGVAAVTVTGTQDGADAGRAGRRGVDARALDAAVRGMVDPGGASATLARVSERGRTAWKGAAGTADFSTGAPVDPDGLFRIGSVTKTFVSTVVLQLVGEGRLRLDDPVEKLLPGAVPNGRNITLRQLLDHTSGLFNYTEDDLFGYQEDPVRLQQWLETGRFTRYTPEQLIAVANAHPPYFEPGQGAHYSNTNYLVVGKIVERVTGHSWQQEVERRIVRRLGLTRTSMPDHSTTIPGPHAHGYYDLPAGPADVTEVDPSMAGAAGAGISTTADLTTFITALIGGRLLPRPLLAEMMTVTPQSGKDTYGLGLQRLSTPCGPVWGHAGGIPGYNTFVYTDGDTRRQFAASVNAFDMSDPAATDAAFAKLLDTGTCGGPPPTATVPAPAPAPAG
ncbi:D-alanyl-D-alanine carboxypeptidase [Streptomyces sp. TLI_053]|uniref:serine hydrolase domain-containing protein n=1 Tax=Streptomyces sp. TLI_053 TaxID=1855352 RepID=UPI000879F7CE|nr:serine hydrolase domain-containing protein [Streptomyces sp. TLI_053]SDT82350.1 D-alanyl-D-alanine carboxypeptidase [Streptomyces sp. TLI_053]